MSRACAFRAIRLDHMLTKLISASADPDDIVSIAGCVSQAVNDWCRVAQIPLPPRPKDGNRPIIDMGMLQELPDDTSLVESLRSKPTQAAASTQPATTPEPTSPPAIDVDQSINPG